MSLPSNVVDASKLFAQRACPPGAIVQHNKLGQGRVRLCDGFWREVDFEHQVTKKSNELASDEWPLEVDFDDLIEVNWTTNITHRLHVHDLVEKAKSHYPCNRVWVGFPC